MDSFASFWPYYLGEHASAACRRWHFLGTGSVVLVAGLVSAGLAPIKTLWALPVVGYGCAWIGHYGFEKNRPATFSHPLWSLLADFKMFGLAITGRLEDEFRRYGIRLKP